MKTAILMIALFYLPGIAGAQSTAKRKLVFDDEFNYTGLPDPSKWGYERGFVRGGEPQYYTVNRLENARVENGMLIIEGRKENYANPNYKPGVTGNEPLKPGLTRRDIQQQFAPYTSASINTYGKHSWKYGRFEVRAKVPPGRGTWPAFWMLGDDHETNKWPKCGEIDIMEYLGRDSTRVHATVHYADSTGKHQQQGNSPEVAKQLANDFHVYAVDWDDKGMTFYYDSLKYYYFDYKKMIGTDGKVFNSKKFYILLNLALGAPRDWGGPQDDSILSAKYYIDYVRVYQ